MPSPSPMASDSINPNQAPSSPSSPSLHHSNIDDAPLSKSDFLTKEEMIKQRHRRIIQLSRVYKDYYWTLMSQLRINYKNYIWNFGSAESIQIQSDNRCIHSNNCNRKPLPMTKFCYTHILSDPEQVLYKGCAFVTSKSGSTVQNVCSKPILRSTTPSFCNYHLIRAKKSVARSLKQAGLSTNDSNRMAPLIHIIGAEFVHEILRKRRNIKKSKGNTDKMEDGRAK